MRTHLPWAVLTPGAQCSLFSEITQKNSLGHMVVICSCVGHCERDFMKFVKYLWAFIEDSDFVKTLKPREQI